MGSKSRGRSTSYPSRRAEKSVRRDMKNAGHLAALEALNFPVSLINREYIYTWVNSGFGAAHGRKPEDIMCRKVPTLWGRETFDRTIKSKLDRCFEGVEVRDESWIKFPALGPRYCEVVYSPYWPEGEFVNSAIVITYDITERKEIERQLKLYQ